MSENTEDVRAFLRAEIAKLEKYILTDPPQLTVYNLQVFIQTGNHILALERLLAIRPDGKSGLPPPAQRSGESDADYRIRRERLGQPIE